MSRHTKVPADGQKMAVNADFSLNVPDNPIILYIQGDGTGVDISSVMIKVVDAAVAKAWGGKRKTSWMEIFAGEKSTMLYGPDVWLPEESAASVCATSRCASSSTCTSACARCATSAACLCR